MDICRNTSASIYVYIAMYLYVYICDYMYVCMRVSVHMRRHLRAHSQVKEVEAPLPRESLESLHLFGPRCTWLVAMLPLGTARADTETLKRPCLAVCIYVQYVHVYIHMYVCIYTAICMCSLNAHRGVHVGLDGN